MNIFKNKQLWTLILAVSISIIMYFLPLSGLSEGGKRTLAILVLGAIFWVSEIIPLYATSLLVLFLELLFLPKVTDIPFRSFISPFFDPVILLFLGGFILSLSISKFGVDGLFTRLIISRFGQKPQNVLMGIMLVVGFLSMWMSNTAATVLGMSLALLIIKSMESNNPFSKALVLGIPFAASIGGMATPIGTPPNAIALSVLKSKGIEISFLRWMGVALPVTILVFIFTYWILLKIFKPSTKKIELKIKKDKKLNKEQIIVLVVFLITVLFWLTGEFHKFDASVGALIPAVVLSGLGLFNQEDLGNIGWDVLLLIGGGLSLGVAIDKSGLSQWFISQAGSINLSSEIILVVFSLFTIFVTTFISNTVAAALIIPLGISFVKDPTGIALIIALSASVAMILPISTPPNAIAYSSGMVKVKDMIKAGTIVSIFSVLMISLAGLFLIGIIK